MKKYLALILALILIPSIVHAAVLLTESFENGWNGWTHDYGGGSIITDANAPDGTRTLQFTFPAGYPGGNAPDIVLKDFAGSNEIYVQYYFKVSSNFVDGG